MNRCALAAIVIACVGPGACQAYNRDAYNALIDVGMDAAEPRDAVDSSDAQPDRYDADSGEPTDAPVGCDPYRVPARPAGVVDADGGTRVLTFGLRRVLFGLGSSDVWRQRGFDRDGLCTNPSQPDSGVACRPRGSAASEDGERGRDNALASNLGALIATRWNESIANNAIERGESSIVVRITNYGGPDDAQVRFEWLPVINGHSLAGGRPEFLGGDVWSINTAIAYDSGSPGVAFIRSESAFVTGGTLVAIPPARAPIRFSNSEDYVRLTLSEGRFVGPISPTGSSFGPMEFSAIWPLSDAYADISTLGICPPPPADRAVTWSFLTSALENAADLLSTLEVSPTVRCDAISMAFSTEWVPVVLGPEMMGTVPRENQCSPSDGGTDGGADAGTDGGADAGIDGGADAGIDGGMDSGADARDGGVDAPRDGTTDRGPDTFLTM